MLTVLMATHNGTDTLGRTLEQFCALVPPPGGWKLLVVNNASTDRTEQLVLGFGNRLPLEYLIEPRLGKPYALNTGLKHVAGDLVVFADDDVLPDPDWLVAWRSAADRNPGYAIFGGTIDLQYESDPPAWFSKGAEKHWEGFLFARTYPRPEGPIPPTESIQGGNMAIRTAALAHDTRFDDRFFAGPLGLMGEEIEFVYRLAARGNKTCFIPSARVRHIVQPGQFAWRRMLRRFYRHGKMMAVLEVQRNCRRPAQIFHIPRWRVRQVLTAGAAVPMALMRCDRYRIFSQLEQIAADLGFIVQSRALHRDVRWRGLASAPALRGSTPSDPSPVPAAATRRREVIRGRGCR